MWYFVYLWVGPDGILVPVPSRSQTPLPAGPCLWGKYELIFKSISVVFCVFVRRIWVRVSCPQFIFWYLVMCIWYLGARLWYFVYLWGKYEYGWVALNGLTGGWRRPPSRINIRYFSTRSQHLRSKLSAIWNMHVIAVVNITVNSQQGDIFWSLTLTVKN